MLQTARATSAVVTSEPAKVHDLCAIRQDRHRRLLAEARDELIRGDEESSLSLCLESLRYERSYEALALAGTLCAILGELEDSVRFTGEAIDLEPNRPDAYYDLGSTLLDMGRVAQARSWLKRGVALLADRDDDLVDFMLGAHIEALAEQGAIEEAEAALREARRRTDDALGLIDGAEEAVNENRGRPRLRLV